MTNEHIAAPQGGRSINYVSLDWCRGLASLAVIADHLRHIVFKDYKEIHSKNIFSECFYFITGLGHEAVIIFFVLSGLLVGGSSLKAIKKNAFSVKNYWISRISRIYTVLIPALIIGGSLDILGLKIFDGRGLYNSSLMHHMTSIGTLEGGRLSVVVFMSNLLMLGGIFTPYLGSNGPLWSLVYEWWYYVIFALLAGMWCFRGVGQFVVGIAFVFMLIVLPKGLLLYGLFWLFGVGLACAPKIRHKWWITFAFVAFVSALIITRLVDRLQVLRELPVDIPFVKDLIVAAAVTILMHALIQLPPRSDNRLMLFNKVGEFFANISFTNYIMHFPFMIFTVAVLDVFFGVKYLNSVTVYAVVIYLMMFIILIIYAYIMYLLFESQTPKIKRYLLGV